MDRRQRELRNSLAVLGDEASPSKKSRQEKENEVLGTGSPPRQGSKINVVGSPRIPNAPAGTLSRVSPSTRARLSEVSIRYSGSRITFWGSGSQLTERRLSLEQPVVLEIVDLSVPSPRAGSHSSKTKSRKDRLQTFQQLSRPQSYVRVLLPRSRRKHWLWERSGRSAKSLRALP